MSYGNGIAVQKFQAKPEFVQVQTGGLVTNDHGSYMIMPHVAPNCGTTDTDKGVMHYDKDHHNT